MFSSAGNNTTNSEMQQGPAAPIINMWQEARVLYGRFKLEKERNLSDSVTAAEIILIFLLR